MPHRRTGLWLIAFIPLLLGLRVDELLSRVDINLSALRLVDMIDAVGTDSWLCAPSSSQRLAVRTDTQIAETVERLWHIYTQDPSRSENSLNLLQVAIQSSPWQYREYVEGTEYGESDILMFREGMNHLVFGNLQAAIMLWDAIPAGAQAVVAGDACRRLGRADGASTWYDIGLVTGADKGETYSRLAMLNYEQSNYDTAAGFFQYAIENDDRDPTTYEYAGAALMKSGAYTEAVTTLQEGLDINPESANLLLWYGQAAYLSGQYDDSEAAYKKFLSIEPENVYAQLGLVRTYLISDQVTAAQEQMRQALQIIDKPFPQDACALWLTLGVSLKDTTLTESANRRCLSPE
jgi:tetratricopeptide (TPR) repeat protein